MAENKMLIKIIAYEFVTLLLVWFCWFLAGNVTLCCNLDF